MPSESVRFRRRFGLDFFGNEVFFREQVEAGGNGRTGQQVQKTAWQDATFQLLDAVADEVATTNSFV
ncbi:MAG: hypothetical protein ABI619_04700, partial [Betaproteobacteria bacterium]